MENKQTAPKEIWVENSDLKTVVESEWAHDAAIWQYKVNDKYVKYLSETHVFEILDAKDKQIDGQRRVVQSFKDRYYEQIELIDSKNKELEYKDKEIERLKLEIARLSENNASLELKISAKYKQGYRDGVKDWEDEHLKNN